MTPQLNTDAPLDLAAAIDYLDDKRNGRVLLKDDMVTLMLFALRAGQDIPEHSVPRTAFLQCLEGAVAVQIAEVEYHLKAGQLLRLPAEIPHAVRALSDARLLLTRQTGA